jgi:Cu-Zn family superoxide dismutase
MPKHLLTLLAVLGTLALGAHAASAMDMRVDMKDPQGGSVGTVSITETAGTVVISANLMNLPAGAHGFHIHEKGSCAPDFQAAGGHFNPAGSEHGVNNANGRHAGDLPNIHVGADGTVKADVFTSAVTLKAGEASSLVGPAGTAFIVHEKADSYGAAAGAGGRIACGVISPAQN